MKTKNKDLQIFVLSFGRAEVPTLKLLACPSDAIVLTSVDNEFKDQIKTDGAQLLVFDKDDFRGRGLEMMNDASVPHRRSAVYAYNYAIEWVRLSVYGTACRREIENVLATRAKKHNAALFYTGIENLRKYTFLLDYFDEVTVKTLNDNKSARLTDTDVERIHALGFKCKQNPIANDFGVCQFAKPCYDPDGKKHKCCLCKAAGGFFGVDKCTVPCIMYNSNKRGELVWNKYGFAI